MGSDGVGGRKMRKGVRKGRRKRRKRKRGGHTMTSPPSYAATSWSGIASPQCQGWCEVVRMEVGEVCRASGCQRWNSSTIAGVWTSVWGSHMLSTNKLDQVPQFTPPEPGVQDLLDFVFLLVIDGDRAGLQRLWTLSNFIWDIGVDTVDGYNRVDVFLSCRESEFDGSRRDDFGDDKRTSPLVIQFLHGVVGGVVLEIQPSFVSNLVLWCCLMVPVIIPLHVIHCPFKGSLSLLLGTIQLPCKGVCGLHS